MNRWALMLAELPDVAQEALCRANRVSLPPNCSPEERIARLRAVVCRPSRVSSIYSRLSSQELFTLLVATASYAGIRLEKAIAEFGPLRPWENLVNPHSVSPFESLLLRGWLVIRPEAPRHPARVMVPPELRRMLPKAIDFLEEDTDFLEEDTDFLEEDIDFLEEDLETNLSDVPPAVLATHALLSAAQQKPLIITVRGRLSRSSLRRVRNNGADTIPSELPPLLAFLLPPLIEHEVLLNFGHGFVYASMTVKR